jgi:hypothetical protein
MPGLNALPQPGQKFRFASSVLPECNAFSQINLSRGYRLRSTRASCPVRSSRWLGGLQPASHGRFIVQVLFTEFPFQVLLFSRYDDIVD